MTEKIIKWRSVKEDGLPAASCDVLIRHPHGLMCVAYSDRYKCFNAHDFSPIKHIKETSELFKDVTFWVPISEIIPGEGTDEKAN